MRKPVSNTIIKIAVCLLAIKEFWLLLGIPSFSNAVISFLTVGAIPGTGHALSPVQIYWMLGAIFVVVLLLVFRKELSGALVRLKVRKNRVRAAAMPIPHPLEPITVIAPLRPSLANRVKQSKWVWRLRGITYVAAMQFVALAKRSRIGLVTLWHKVEPYIRRFDRWLEKQLRQNQHTATLLSIGGEVDATVRKLAKDAKDFTKSTPSFGADRRQS